VKRISSRDWALDRVNGRRPWERWDLSEDGWAYAIAQAVAIICTGIVLLVLLGA